MDSKTQADLRAFLSENPSFLQEWILNEADCETVEKIAFAVNKVCKI